MSGGCSYDDQFRGTDRSAVLPSVRARLARDDGTPPAKPNRVHYQPTLEGAVSYGEGDFAQQSIRPEYEVFAGHVAFAPEFSWRGVRLSPIVGLAYGDVTVTSAMARASQNGLGVAFGVEAAWQGWSWFEPYVRYVDANGFDWRVARLEVGVGLRMCEVFGVQIAYARQTSEVHELSFFGAGDAARIETEGVHVGLSLRF
ncbi:MAG: hypothetical protein ABIP94_18200 [Planctomycetota bacterium]